MKMRRKLRREQEIEKNKQDDQIFIPSLVGIVVTVIGGVISITTNSYAGKIIIGLGLIIMASSSYWQIKYKYVPGMPPIRGVWAIIFSVIWTIILVVGAFAFMFLE
jgi:hypothetical protein